MPRRSRSGEDNGASVQVRQKKINWIAWIALLLGVLASVYALLRNGQDEQSDTTPASNVVAATPNATTCAALVGTAGLGAYLVGKEVGPRTFTFETFEFETAKSDIRPVDRAEVDQVATALNRYPSTQVRIAGYADARGSDAANTALGKARAESVKAALVAKGIDGSRIQTATGGDGDPVDTNASTSGQQENRRTELVVTQH